MFRSAWIERQRDVHDRRVEDDHELREADQREHEPRVDVLRGQDAVSTSPARAGGTVTRMPPKKRNWIQEERRKTLGDYTCFCLDCGSVWRYFLEGESELPDACPNCGGETRHRCPECSAPFPSAFAVECEECGAEVRPPEVLGVRIRKPGR